MSNTENSLTPKERAELESQLVWTVCPVCEGSVVGEPLGNFCMACTTSGKVLKSTANILENMMPFISAWRERDLETRAAIPVTDEMVERALLSSLQHIADRDGDALDYENDVLADGETHNALSSMMRAALTAALAGRNQ